ncbi:MAG: VWA domain-containing protein [Chlorobiaceae bacterium]|nr:VWA domain-containing protein [Chlorobiaceae bacterium]NTW10832.1 VWA domain-containing protein [Chlorobiaceae bacterium]
MKKYLLPLIATAIALPNIPLEAKPAVSSKNAMHDGVSLKKVMDGYARQYDNLRPIEGRCPNDYRLIQICLLLDTSNSMDGLINQAKSQLWQIVNDLSRMQKRGENIQLEVALYEYGNNALSASSGYIRQVSPFTRDLDRISEALFSLDTNGGSEYCGHVIGSSLNQLRWNSSREGLNMIFIAGNEPFDQGSVNYEAACRWALEKGIAVNTIYCGDYRSGVETFWKRGAMLGGGSYFSIDSDRLPIDVPTPYDDDLVMLNSRINKTYIPYGRAGKESFERQSAQDMNAVKLAAPVSAARASTKASPLYKASEWDLVDALDDKKITTAQLKKEELPEELRSMSPAQLDAHVQQKKSERAQVKAQIADLGRKRDAYLIEKRKENAGAESLGSAIQKNLRTQAEAKKFIWR